MKNIFFKIFLFSNLLTLFFFPVQSQENKILVRVENEIITSFQLKNKIRTSLILSNQEVNQEHVNRFKNQSLISLINLKLKKIEIEKYKIEPDLKKVNEQLKKITSNNLETFKANFKKNNLDFDIFLEEIKIQNAWQKLIFLRYNTKVNIDEKEIENEIKDLKMSKTEIEEFKISEIEINSSEKIKNKENISFINEQIDKIGLKTAFKFSISTSSINKGDLGWVNSKALSLSIYDVLKKMKIGDISKPFIRNDSILFLKLSDKRFSESKQINEKQLKESLIAQKKNEMYNLYSRSHLSKIRNNALIEY